MGRRGRENLESKKERIASHFPPINENEWSNHDAKNKRIKTRQNKTKERKWYMFP